MRNINFNELPTSEQWQSEVKRIKYRNNFWSVLRNTVSSLIVISAIAVIISTMLLPVLRVTGTSMTPTLQNDEILLCSKLSDYECGDIIAFYYNNKVLIKRVIGLPGDVIDIAEDGTVYVNGEALNESYVSKLAKGECDVDFSSGGGGISIPDGRFFVIGDNREISIDSRSTSIGNIAEENIIGKVFLRVYPLGRFGGV